MESLNLLEESIFDNNVESFKYYDYAPQSQSNLDVLGTPIVIDINTNDTYVQPSKSYLVIKTNLLEQTIMPTLRMIKLL